MVRDNSYDRRNFMTSLLVGGRFFYYGKYRFTVYSLLLIQLLFSVDCGKPFNYDKKMDRLVSRTYRINGGVMKLPNISSTNDTAHGEFPYEDSPNPDDFIPDSTAFPPSNSNSTESGNEEDYSNSDPENHIAHGESNHLNNITNENINVNYANKNDNGGEVNLNDGQEIGESVENLDKEEMTSTVNNLNNDDNNDIDEITHNADSERREDNFNNDR